MIAPNRRNIFVGIGIGASRVKVVGLDASGVSWFRGRDHLGEPRAALEALLSGVQLEAVAGLAVTGREGTHCLLGDSVYESEAVEACLCHEEEQPDLVVSLGGESFVVYPIAADGTVQDYVSGNRCAAGTVEFFKQQVGRMGLTVDQASGVAREGTVVPLARRCSVHCKSDCTHALNKKKCTVADIVRTLCHNMAEKVAGLVRSTGVARGRILVVGGATANPVIIEHIREFLPEFSVTVPSYAAYAEALGAATIARERSLPIPERWEDLFCSTTGSFGFLAPLSNYEDRVRYVSGGGGELRADREYLLGVDGGSTTTKVALVDRETLAICGSHYTRTNGNPEQAFKVCLDALLAQIKAATGADSVPVAGVATTGSSGEILSVLCGTPWFHNEIVAHAAGATHVCPDVDTIFEIGGQDAKFTSLRAGVAVDFNMNESCSAGTGSFIEEAARDDLGVAMEDISGLALAAENPPRFSDQCAAFANTDTRKAFQEGSSREDNLAGLIYSIVENYLSKVVGQRRVGDRILFQGGTSRNRAIACALAARTGKVITVPPDAELMGCFGIALWLRGKVEGGVADANRYDLSALRQRTVSESEEFPCTECENACTIQRLTIDGERYPFGGRCSKWENVRAKVKTETRRVDLVAERNRMLYEDFGVAPHKGANGHKPSVGFQNVFSVCTFYPLYSWFFYELGYTVTLSETVRSEGVHRCQSARCYPYEIAHGTLADLIARGVGMVFVPHLVQMPRDGEDDAPNLACPIEQAAPYYLGAAFGGDGVRLLRPVLDMSDGLESVQAVMVSMAGEMGHSEAAAIAAFRKGCGQQRAYWHAAKDRGEEVLADLEAHGETGVVLVGRPYNAYSRTANMGVPRKFASAGVTILPCEFLPLEQEECEETMYWKHGREILKSLRFVKKRPNLFAVYLSNFGCGPDSFIQHFAHSILGSKPYLFLELDSHTADAGIATRVAAFLDIACGYNQAGMREAALADFRIAEFVSRGRDSVVVTSSGERVSIRDPRVTLAIPSMGRFDTEGLAAAARRFGFNAVAMPPADERVLRIGREYTSGKECSPAIVTTGSMINYWREEFRRTREDEILLVFMPTAGGPCRFGQYNVYLKMLIRTLRMEDVAIFSLTADDGYRGLGMGFLLAAWESVVLTNLVADVRAVLKVAAEDPTEAAKVMEESWQEIREGIARGRRAMWKAVRRAARKWRDIPLALEPRDVPRVLLAGEIYVRCDELSCRGIDDWYAREGMMLKRADTMEWIYYTDWRKLNSVAGRSAFPSAFLGWRTFWGKLWRGVARWDRDAWTFVRTRLKLALERRVECKGRRLLGRSGLLVTESHDVDHVIRDGAEFINPALSGEAILSAGSTRRMMEKAPGENYCGVVFIGPFNCMPTGVAESVAKPYARRVGIPYLTFETDAGPIPPNLRSQIEVHMLRARRFHARSEEMVNG